MLPRIRTAESCSRFLLHSSPSDNGLYDICNADGWTAVVDDKYRAGAGQHVGHLHQGVSSTSSFIAVGGECLVPAQLLLRVSPTLPQASLSQRPRWGSAFPGV